MGERRERPTRRLDSSDLQALAKKSIVADEAAAVAAEPAPDDDPLTDWDELNEHVVAAGSQSNALPTTSRTTTVTDPLTTQLLAEVARRTATMEFDPAAADGDRATQEIDPDTLRSALLDAEKAPVPTEPHPRTKRRTKSER